MKKIISTVIITATILQASTKPLHVELNIYKNITFITKSFNLDKKGFISLSLPKSIQLENIEIKSKNCKATEVLLSVPKATQNRKITLLKQKIAKLQNQISSLRNRNDILKTISLKEKKESKYKSTLDFFTTNYKQDIDKISLLQNELAKTNKELKIAQNQKASLYKNFSATFTCRAPSGIDITYPEYNFKIVNFYNIKANTLKKSLSFNKMIKIEQKSGEDFTDIDIYSHSNAYNRKVAPAHFYPRYLNIYQKKRLAMTKNMLLADSATPLERSYKRGYTTSSFVLKHIDIKNNRAKIFTVNTQNQKVDFQNDIDGYGTSLAYLKAKFKSDKIYQSANAFIYLDGNRIGTMRVGNIKKGTKLDIYFGENQNIKVTKTLQKRFNESEFFGNKKIKTQLWLYKIKNLSKISKKVNLIERLPISQNEDIKVEPLYDTKKANIDKKGRVVWSFKLKYNETKSIKFGYKITKPKE